MDTGFVKYHRKPENVIAKDYNVETSEDREMMFQEIKSFFGKDNNEWDKDIISALCPKGDKYTVIVYENGNVGWSSSDIFYRNYESDVEVE